jgi:hypothetical protein
VKRKNPYSQINVNEVSIEVLCQGRAGHKAVVGVDVGKAELTFCLVWPDREFERPWRVKAPREIRLGISKLLELNKLCPVTVAMESSGTYGDAFRQGLEDAGLPVERVSGKAVSAVAMEWRGRRWAGCGGCIGSGCIGTEGSGASILGQAVGCGSADQADLVREVGGDAGAALAGGGDADESIGPDADGGAAALGRSAGDGGRSISGQNAGEARRALSAEREDRPLDRIGKDDGGRADERLGDPRDEGQRRGVPQGDGIESHRAFKRNAPGEAEAEQARAAAAEEVVVFFIIALDAGTIGEDLACKQEAAGWRPRRQGGDGHHAEARRGGVARGTGRSVRSQTLVPRIQGGGGQDMNDQPARVRRGRRWSFRTLRGNGALDL